MTHAKLHIRYIRGHGHDGSPFLALGTGVLLTSLASDESATQFIASLRCDDDDCPGYFRNVETHEIERCDTCEAFYSDDDAAEYVRRRVKGEE
jgi:hypothetical protein